MLARAVDRELAYCHAELKARPVRRRLLHKTLSSQISFTARASRVQPFRRALTDPASSLPIFVRAWLAVSSIPAGRQRLLASGTGLWQVLQSVCLALWSCGPLR